MSSFVRSVAKKVLPGRTVDWYRRRRALRRYFRLLGAELYHRQSRMGLEELEGRVAARRQGFYEGLVRDVLDRTDIVLQALDRKIEGVSTRHGHELERLRDQTEELRASVERLRQAVEGRAAAPVADPAPARSD